MEYLLGSLLTMLAILFANMVLKKKIRSLPPIQIIYSQSLVHDIVKPFLPTNKELREETLIKTQSRKHSNKNSLRVLFVENRAYWIQDNALYTADLIDGLVDQESAAIVDTMAMDKVQLKEMSFIVDKLTEGIDDENRYSGK